MAILTAELMLITSFQDADPLGIIYHGNYFRYFEEVRRLLMEQIGYCYLEMKASGYAYPVVEAKVNYIQPIRFHHAIRVTGAVVEWENRLRIDYRIFDVGTGKRLTRAHTIQVAVRTDTGELCLVMPDVFMERLISCQMQHKVACEG